MKRYILAFLAMMTLTVGVLVPAARAAPVDVFNEACTYSADSQLCTDRNKKLFGPGSIWTNIVNTMIYIGGAAALLMIVIGGLRYTLSGGNTADVTSAKNTIMYAVIGLIMSVMSYAIVNFVLSRI